MAAVLDVTVLAHRTNEPERHELRRTGLWIGRDPMNSICLNDGFVSRFHAEIQKRGDMFYVLDMSLSGTWLDGKRLPTGSDAGFELRDGHVRTCHTPVATLPQLSH